MQSPDEETLVERSRRGDPGAFEALVVSYQSGIGICAHYLGAPTAMWWRPKGDSAAAHAHISFEEAMAHCWTNPAYRGRYLPLIYGRCSVEDIVTFARGTR